MFLNVPPWKSLQLVSNYLHLQTNWSNRYSGMIYAGTRAEVFSCFEHDPMSGGDWVLN